MSRPNRRDESNAQTVDLEGIVDARDCAVLDAACWLQSQGWPITRRNISDVLRISAEVAS